jgi:hypothetical protein
LTNKISATLLLITLLSIITAGHLYPEKKQDRKKKALTKSLLYPGLGQLYEKQYVKGALFLAAETFCVITAIINNYHGNRYYDRYRTADNIDDAVAWREQTVTYDKRRNLYIFAGVGIWVLNMIDIYIYTKKKYKKGVSLFIKQNAGNYSISFGFRFTF